MAKEKKAEFTRWLGPLLDALRDLGGSGVPQEVSNRISQNLALSKDKVEETLESGMLKFHNQVAWARQYLVWEGLLESSKRGIWSLTKKGYETKLSEKEGHDIFLKWVKIYQKAREDKKNTTSENIAEDGFEQKVEQNAENNLLEILQRISPKGFEMLCQRLLRESGFVDVEVTGSSHDGGIDGFGILEINPLVSFKVIFQCKRYKGTVSRAQVGDFRNAMIGRAEKGIILTTGTFSLDAQKEANRDGAPKIELIDGEKLVSMFENLELGLRPKVVYEIDTKFFEQYI